MVHPAALRTHVRRALTGTRLVRRWRRQRGPADRGAVMFWVIPLMVGLVAMAGLIVDGGNAIAARERAEDVSQQAARAGADALSPLSLHAAVPGALTADRGAAQAAAERVLAAAGISNPTVTVDGDSVTVSVTVHEKTQVLSAFGLSEISGSASSTATALHGTTTGGTR
jgi:Flp pilus assembly protein TadG